MQLEYKWKCFPSTKINTIWFSIWIYRFDSDLLTSSTSENLSGWSRVGFHWWWEFHAWIPQFTHKRQVYHFPVQSDNWISFVVARKRISSNHHKRFLEQHLKWSNSSPQTWYTHQSKRCTSIHSPLGYRMNVRFMCWLICIRVSLARNDTS